MLKKLIVANWKLNPESIREAKEILAPVKRALSRLTNLAVVICPPAVFLSDLAKIKGGQIALGAQDAFWERDGAYTGMLSPTMLRNAGADYLILGHSERRRLGDGDGEINRKVALALKHRLKVILCVGEERRDPDGFYLQTIRTQLEAGLAGVPKKQLNELIVAYEPVWAIGEAARASDTPRDFLEQ